MSVGTLERPRAAHLGPERRRPHVLDAALAIAVERGVAAVTMGAVAERLDVTRPVVYSCFADRVELIRALLDREHEVLLVETIAALPHNRADADEAVFVEGFQRFLEAVSHRLNSWRLLMIAEPDPAVAEHFRSGRAAVSDYSAGLLWPTLKHWGTTDAERKLPVLVEQFMSACEGAVRTLLLDDGHDWPPTTLGAFIGSAIYRAFRTA